MYDIGLVATITISSKSIEVTPVTKVIFDKNSDDSIRVLKQGGETVISSFAFSKKGCIESLRLLSFELFSDAVESGIISKDTYFQKCSEIHKALNSI